MSNIGTKFILAQRFIFDPNCNILIDQENNNEVTRLGSNESRILMMFSERPNEVISRDQLHEFVWRDQGFQVDDSSLTQAISTLRKQLNDSTKSPQFIKTVPKRGYQLISPVEKAPIFTANDTAADEEAEPQVKPEELVTDTRLIDSADETPQPESAQAEPQVTTVASDQFRIKAKYILALAVLLPFLVLAVINPAPSKFRLFETIDGVPLKTTEGHPPMDEWKSVIRSCYRSYAAKFPEKEKPMEIIATAGTQRNLILNYIHPVEYSYKNITINLFANKEELSELCQ